ncbi:MAG: cation transporter [Nitrospiria bacterium]
MKCVRSIVILAMFLSFSVSSANAGEAARINLRLGGKFCREYLTDLEKVLKNMDGVKTVNLKCMKGHAIVEVEPEKVKPAQLVEVVKGIKGKGWHCMAEVMCETGKLYRL